MNGPDGVYERLLQSCNVDPNAIDLGQPPLISAVQLGSMLVFDQLLRKPNVEVNIGDQQQRAALWWAVHRGHIEMTQRLLSHEDILIDCTNTKEGLTPLAIAARYGHLQIMQHLLETGRPNVNFSDNCGQTPIFHAIGRRNQRAFEILLAEDTINLAHQDNQERSPLSYAVTEGCQFAVEMLLEKGADMYLDEGNRLTAFQRAV
ncbi:ankyrin repeat domain-containing protein [Aspergillus melleus]|uniref:ankyrin repeat domain-containing protein n=1 Tax=Aspergillus melleus TaxID=138277 RepID=UPI001E8E62A6|nr:uncharacterized protein LDX57_008674 [Aspergillus melleus]KAH8431013.1 hypothetical protein LDX57_008674 [Aspergillus melleus]